jgi:2,5-diketo-D-gluconate reductase A
MSGNAITQSIPQIELNDGRQIPQLGFGVFQIPPEETTQAVAHALRTGYRHIDTAAAYRNEAQVGEAIRASGLDREEVFVTTKLWNTDHDRDRALRAFERSLERLGDDYVDLYLIHWPVPTRGKYVEAWETLVELHDQGRARSIGVSNFEIAHLERSIEATGVVPAVNQIELHPRFQQRQLRRVHSQRRIVTEAWSPLGQGVLLKNETVTRIAEAKHRTPAQVILGWHIQLGNVVFPKSVTPTRIEENARIFDFELDDEDMEAIASLDSPNGRMGGDPATFVAP